MHRENLPPWAGTILLIFAALCLVLGLGAAIPDGREFYLRVFNVFRDSLPGSKSVSRRDAESTTDDANNNANLAPVAGEEESQSDQSAANRQTGDNRLAAEHDEPGGQTAATEDGPEPLPGMASGPKVRLEERWRLANKSEIRLRNLMGPTYLLDETYHFLDWNPIFDELIAKQLKLYRGLHAAKFVDALANRDVVIPRAQQRFPENAPPLVDLEPLVFVSDRFGTLEFQKIASRLLDEKGNTLLWVVTLNISDVEEKYAQDLWTAIHDKLVEVANWTAYAASYDKLLTNFDDYAVLIDAIVSRVGDAKKCIDLGAGTGNTALKLLERPDRMVWAVEENDGMLHYLDGKVKEISQKAVRDRLITSKANVNSLGEFPRGFFDAATMTNVLYAVDSPVDCLKEINRVLKVGGALVLSTSTNETDVDKLFDIMRENLQMKGLFDDLRTNWTDAKEVHQRLDTKIHRDTKADIRAYLERTGFKIDEESWVDSAYVDAVVVAKAVKVREAF
jgi:ubiquinone/menaquinone biosynthesis C-methylase UbiE